MCNALGKKASSTQSSPTPKFNPSCDGEVGDELAATDKECQSIRDNVPPVRRSVEEDQTGPSKKIVSVQLVETDLLEVQESQRVFVNVYSCTVHTTFRMSKE